MPKLIMKDGEESNNFSQQKHQLEMECTNDGSNSAILS